MKVKKINLNIGLQEIKMDKIIKVHDYLESCQKLGKFYLLDLF